MTWHAAFKAVNKAHWVLDRASVSVNVYECKQLTCANMSLN